MSLEEYFAKHIWEPVGVRDFSFFPTDDLRARLMQMCSRTREGQLIHTEKLRPVPKLRPEDIGVQSGGGGLIGVAREYLTFLQHLLRCRDEAGIISPASFRELFTDSLPPRDGSHECHESLGAFLKMRGYPEEQYTSGAKVGYSPGLCLNLATSVNGRKAGSGFWFGAARSEYWIDPASGVIVSGRLQRGRRREWSGEKGRATEDAEVRGLTPGHVRDAADERPREVVVGGLLVV